MKSQKYYYLHELIDIFKLPPVSILTECGRKHVPGGRPSEKAQYARRMRCDILMMLMLG